MRDLRHAARSVSITSALSPTARIIRSVPRAIAAIAAFAVLAHPGRAGAQGAPATPPCQAPEHRQFDFWIGEWDVETADGAVAGTNRIDKILNGCVLLENWQGAQGSTGKSFNMYFAADDTWRQTWVDGNGGRLDLAGGLDGKDMVLAGEMPGRSGGRVRHEIRWTPLEDGRVKQHWRVMPPGLEEWRDAFVGFYTRKSVDPQIGDQGRGGAH